MYTQRNSSKKSENAIRQMVNMINEFISSKWGRRIVLCVCGCVFVVSTFLLLNYAFNTKKAYETNEEMQRMFAMGANQAESTPFLILPKKQINEPTPETVLKPTPNPTQTVAILQADTMQKPATMPSNSATIAPSENIATTTVTPKQTSNFFNSRGNILPQMKQLYAINDDVVAWVKIPNVVDTPVAYSDNDFYLKHNLYGEEELGGTAFLDENHPLHSSIQNLLIHGHNMKNGTVFGHLQRYTTSDFWRKNSFIELTTLYEKMDFVICAAIITPVKPSGQNFFNFMGYAKFEHVNSFYNYINEVKRLSLYPWSVDVDKNDTLLTLATCHGEDRMVLVARKLREGETKLGLTKKIFNVLFPNSAI